MAHTRKECGTAAKEPASTWAGPTANLLHPKGAYPHTDVTSYMWMASMGAR
jgi:hypothetical protein